MPARGLLQVRCTRRHGSLQDARRGQAVPALGLPQASCFSWHTVLHPAWRRQAVPARGLLQGSSDRRHAALPGARRRQAVPARGLHQGSRSSSSQHALHAMSAAHTAAARRRGGAVTLRTPPVTQLREREAIQRLVEDFA
jgi:hypothetical protein